ncbi:MAG: crotonase/enoyl-CoA hydratase family protein [Geminicoccaceae bacterium]
MSGQARPWTCERWAGDVESFAFFEEFDRIEFSYEENEKLLLCTHGDQERPCYTRPLLAELLKLFDFLRTSHSDRDQATFPLNYVVWKSSTPGIWNLGGDLALFIKLIETGDIEALRAYAHLCVEVVYQNFAKGDLPYLSIALVQGDALGGGFEAVLSNDIVIAEEHVQFGLPEIVFNMFPGMGAYSLLARKLSTAEARSMIMSGRLYSAKELHDLGLIDMVAPSGAGEEGLRTFLDRNRRRHRALVSMSRVSRRCSGIDFEELIDVANIWVENAMGISSSDLRRMRRLVRAQMRRYAEGAKMCKPDVALPAHTEAAAGSSFSIER